MRSIKKSGSIKREIPPLRQAFIKHLIADPEMCAARAYRAAGYKVKNPTVATVEGNKLLAIPYIAEAIAKEKEKRARRLDATADKTLLKLMRGQEFDIRKLYKLSDDGQTVQLKTPLELDDDTAAAVVGVKYKDGLIEEYKIIDVKGCTISVGEHLGMFKQKIDITSGGKTLTPYSELELANRIATLLMKAKKNRAEASK